MKFFLIILIINLFFFLIYKQIFLTKKIDIISNQNQINNLFSLLLVGNLFAMLLIEFTVEIDYLL